MADSEVLTLDSPIVDFKYLGSLANARPTVQKPALEQVSESTQRPAALSGKSYKLKSPIYEAALYITINDITLNEGTKYEQRRPFEIFINSKAMENFQWITALTRMISAVFRKGGDVNFVVEELKSVCDPRGGYWKHGSYITSIVAEIGMVIEDHLIELGLLESDKVSVSDKAVMHSPPTDQILAKCPSCSAPAMVFDGGCARCINCGYSKCS
jgi:hypothetical protein